MENLYSFAFYALVTPVITLGAGSVLAQQSTGQDTDREQQSTQHKQGAMQSTPGTVPGDQSKERLGRSDSQTAADHQNTRDQSRMRNPSYMDSVPDNGMRASNLIGTKVKTTSDKDVGSVDDLILDENARLVAIVVGDGGSPGMGRMRALRRNLKDGIESRHPPLMAK